jgi:putative membrane protein insertion efficiency factor
VIERTRIGSTTAPRLRWRFLAGATTLVAIAAGLLLNAQPLGLAAVHGYQRALAPIAARAGMRCRFTPTCSRYAGVVIERDGMARGGWKALKRIARCGPWTPAGTRDEP